MQPASRTIRMSVVLFSTLLVTILLISGGVHQLWANQQSYTLAAGDRLIATCATRLRSHVTGVQATLTCIQTTPTRSSTAQASATSELPLAPASRVQETPTSGATAQWDPVAGLGVIGDSSDDEYRGTDARGGVYSANTFNWLELLVRKRGLPLGEWGAYPEPRRTGYAFNFARSGATTDSMLSDKQPQQVAALIREGQVSHVYIGLGINDFTLTGLGQQIRDNTISPTDLEARLHHIVANITVAVQTVQAAKPAGVLLEAVKDPTVVFLSGTGYDADSEQRARLHAAIAHVNAALRTMAAHEGIHFFDPMDEAVTVLAQRVHDSCLIVGQACFTLSSGDEPHNIVLKDGHVGTVFSGLQANMLISQFHHLFGTNITPFSDDELLAAAGIR